MAVQTAAGASIAFSASLPATVDQAGYAALTYSVAVEVTQIGGFGRVYNLVTHLPLSARGATKAKGSYNNGTINPTMAYDAGDAGYGILNTAKDSDAPISAQVTLQNGDVFYFQALVMGMATNVGEADSIVMAEPQLEITRDDIVEVTA